MNSSKIKKPPNPAIKPSSGTIFGANERSRTADLFITNEVLCLLSYVSMILQSCVKYITTMFHGISCNYNIILQPQMFVKRKN